MTAGLVQAIASLDEADTEAIEALNEALMRPVKTANAEQLDPLPSG